MSSHYKWFIKNSNRIAVLMEVKCVTYYFVQQFINREIAAATKFLQHGAAFAVDFNIKREKYLIIFLSFFAPSHFTPPVASVIISNKNASVKNAIIHQVFQFIFVCATIGK